jgi:hypothetical protein
LYQLLIDLPAVHTNNAPLTRGAALAKDRLRFYPYYLIWIMPA